MRAPTAAAYLDEPSVEAFRRKVGSAYPLPVQGKGERQKWDRVQLDQAVDAKSRGPENVLDAASVL
jgi:hypothetical protein